MDSTPVIVAAIDALPASLKLRRPQPGIELDNMVYTIALSADTLSVYVGGIYTTIGGQARNVSLKSISRQRWLQPGILIVGARFTAGG